jgi:hypothetical protein
MILNHLHLILKINPNISSQKNRIPPIVSQSSSSNPQFNLNISYQPNQIPPNISQRNSTPPSISQ